MEPDRFGRKALVFSGFHAGDNPGNLGQSDALLVDFCRFLDAVAADTAAGGDGPVGVCRFFEYLDEAVDPAPLLAALAASGRQVQVTVGGGYPLDALRMRELPEIRIEEE